MPLYCSGSRDVVSWVMCNGAYSGVMWRKVYAIPYGGLMASMVTYTCQNCIVAHNDGWLLLL